MVAISTEAYQVLCQYRWPGNVRELQNVIRRGIVLTQDAMIDVDDLPDSLVAAAGDRGQTGGVGFFCAREEHVRQFEHAYLTGLLRKHAGNVREAAEEARLPRGTMYRLMKNHNLDGADFR